MTEEDHIQAAIVLRYRRNYAGLIFAVANGGSRNRLEAIKLKATGVKAGHPDLIIYSPKGVYLMEVKTETGPLTKSQEEVFPQLQDLGLDLAIVRSADEAEAAFKAWGLPRKEFAVRFQPETGF